MRISPRQEDDKIMVFHAITEVLGSDAGGFILPLDHLGIA